MYLKNLLQTAPKYEISFEFQAPRRTRSFIPGTRKDRDNGKLKPQRGCINHEIYRNQQTIVQLRKKSSVEGQRAYRDLVNSKLIDERVKHVFLSCLNYNCNNYPEQEQRNEEIIITLKRTM